jgi:hypothetical protein
MTPLELAIDTVCYFDLTPKERDRLINYVKRAIAAAVAEEREDAAWECDQVAKNWADDVQRPAAEECAARIRARSTEGGDR